MNTLTAIAILRAGLPAAQQHRIDAMLIHEGAAVTLAYLKACR